MSKVTAFTHGTVLTLDSNRATCEAILLEDRRIAALGRSDEIERLCQEKGGQLIDLKGSVVLPGFQDGHTHILSTGLNASGIDLYDCTSIDEVLQKIRAASHVYPKERWIFANRLDESRLQEKRPPTAAELDRAAPEHPVYILDRGLHYTLVNSRTFQLLGIDPDTPGVRKGPGGEPNGRLQQKANSLAKQAFLNKLDRATREQAILYTANRAAQAGVTTLHGVEGGELFSDEDIPVLIDLQPGLPVWVVLYWSTENLEQVQAAGLPRIGGDYLVDGSIGSRTAAFDAPYSDEPATSGLLYYTDARLEELITSAHLAGLQTSFHMIGERAIRQGLDCFERVLARYPKADHRHRIEHFGFPKAEDIERAARLGMSISTQPAFTLLRGGPGSVYNLRLGDARERRGYPLRSLLDAGLNVGGGSDSDVTPIDPLLGVHAAVNPPYPEHAVSVDEALRMFTFEVAKMAFEEKEKGTLEIGKLGDMTVLAQNPLTAAKESLKDIQVLMTVKAGEVVYQKEH